MCVSITACERKPVTLPPSGKPEALYARYLCVSDISVCQISPYAGHPLYNIEYLFLQGNAV